MVSAECMGENKAERSLLQKRNVSDPRHTMGLWVSMALAALFLAFQPATTLAQSSGDGSIEGKVTDQTGAVIPNATVKATNNATHVQSIRTSTSSGVFDISPLVPGIYTLTVTAKGFETLEQDSLDVVAVNVLAYNPILTVGATTQTVTVTQAPPVLDTDSAVLTAVMENEVYANLPVLMSPNPSVQIQMRDPTSFAVLTPGTVASTRTPIISGTNEYAAFVYLDGVPEEMINQQGDNRDISLNMDIDAVDQFQVLSSVPPAQYSGAGSLNFTMKSGGLQFHGGANDFVRNTIFDAWLFSQKEATYKIPSGATIPAPKNIEHQNELSIFGSGYIPHTGKKLFFFIAYDKFHARESIAPNQTTIPTTLMEQGDFTEAANQTFNGTGQSGEGSTNNPFLFDPMTNNCTSSGCSRQPFQGVKNGAPTFNVIPTGDLSPTTVKMESFLPNYPGSPNAAFAGNVNPNVFNNNFLNTGVQGRDDYEWDWRWDYDISSRNRVSAVGAIGRDTFEGDDSNFNFILPYTVGFVPVYLPKQFVVEDAYTITSHLNNQFKVGFTRLFQPFTAPTNGLAAQYAPSVFGITNLPAGQINGQFPGTTFGGSSKAESITPANWTANNNGDVNELTDPNTYELIDNVQYLKGNHVMSWGFSYLFEGLNIASPETLTGVLDLPFGQDSTASYVQGTGTCATGVQGCSTSVDTSATGYGYASYLIGAVSQISNFALQYVPNIYNRIKTAAPYVEDSWKASKKLTIDMGLRWDYMPPYHEKFNHFSFLNTTAVNPATGTPGAMEFAGNYGGATGTVSCNCKTPVMTYWKNYGPRIGLVYSVNDKSVIRVGFGITYSNAGGTGSGRVPGLGGANGGQQPLGFNTAVTSPTEGENGVNAGPSFWLNNNSGYLGARASTALFGPGTTFPTPPAPGVQTQILNTGNYINGSVGGVTNPNYAAGAVVPASGMTYEDPYFEGRAAEFNFYNLGIERTISKDMTLQVNYAGSESHHSQGVQNMRGYWDNALNPAYLLALGGVAGNNSAGKANSIPLLLAPATSANVAILNNILPGAASTASAFVAAANAFPTNSALTIQQLLTAFPQFSSIDDALGGTYNVNTAYNSLQITVSQRTAHGLTFNLNYTYSKNLGDEGNIRNGFALPSGAVDGATRAYKQDRIDRSWESTSQPQELNIYGVYKLPFGTGGHFGGTSLLTRELVGGWQLSAIYQYYSGAPYGPTWGAGGNCANNTPNAGTCMPSYNPSFSGPARINGSYGSGPGGVTFANASNIHYVNPAIFAQPADLSTVAGFHQYLIGNAARTRPYNINGPGNQQTSASVRRSFSLPREMAFIFEADVSNLWNKMQWGSPGGSWGITIPGTSPVYNNSFGQLSAPSTQPRDWQFAGRLSF